MGEQLEAMVWVSEAQITEAIRQFVHDQGYNVLEVNINRRDLDAKVRVTPRREVVVAPDTSHLDHK